MQTISGLQQVQNKTIRNNKNPTDFNHAWNLVRDQEVGGSNPLAPTNIFNKIAAAWDRQKVAAGDLEVIKSTEFNKQQRLREFQKPRAAFPASIHIRFRMSA